MDRWQQRDRSASCFRSRRTEERASQELHKQTRGEENTHTRTPFLQKQSKRISCSVKPALAAILFFPSYTLCTYCPHACAPSNSQHRPHLKRWSIKYLIFCQDWQRPLTKTSHFYRLCPKGPGSYYSSTEWLARSINFLLVGCSRCVKPVHTQRVWERREERLGSSMKVRKRTSEPPWGELREMHCAEAGVCHRVDGGRRSIAETNRDWHQVYTSDRGKKTYKYWINLRFKPITVGIPIIPILPPQTRLCIATLEQMKPLIRSAQYASAMARLQWPWSRPPRAHLDWSRWAVRCSCCLALIEGVIAKANTFIYL